MDKFKMTKTDVMSTYKVFKTGYCRLQNLLFCVPPIGYTTGTYGWNSDIYILTPNIALSTGYRPFGIEIPTSIVDKYEKKAKEISSKCFLYLEREKKLKPLLDKFIQELEKLK